MGLGQVPYHFPHSLSVTMAIEEGELLDHMVILHLILMKCIHGVFYR